MHEFMRLAEKAVVVSSATLVCLANTGAQEAPRYAEIAGSLEVEMTSAPSLPALGRPNPALTQQAATLGPRYAVAPVSHTQPADDAKSVAQAVHADSTRQTKQDPQKKGVLNRLASKWWNSGQASDKQDEAAPTPPQVVAHAAPIQSYVDSNEPEATLAAHNGGLSMRVETGERPSLFGGMDWSGGSKKSSQSQASTPSGKRRGHQPRRSATQSGPMEGPSVAKTKQREPSPKMRAPQLMTVAESDANRSDRSVAALGPASRPLALPAKEAMPMPIREAKPPKRLIESDEETVASADARPNAEMLENRFVASNGQKPQPKVVLPDSPLSVARSYPHAERRSEPVYAEPPSERSRELLTEAHALATYAESFEDYSAILQRCRMVLAIDTSDSAIDYANKLAGWALNKRGEGLIEADRGDDAEIDFREAIRTDSECWRAEHNLGVLVARRGEMAEALQRFNRTIDLNPEFAKAYANRASVAIQRGEFETANSEYLKAIDIDPDFAEAHAGRGRLCHMLGEFDQALRHLDAAELLTPQEASLAVSRGDLLLDMGRYAQARSAYERAIELDRESPLAYCNLAWMQATCPVAAYRDGQNAIANAERSIELSGDEPDDIALDTLAAALAEAGRFEEAIELAQMAIDIAPAADAEAYQERLDFYKRGESYTSYPYGEIEPVAFVSDEGR